MKKIIFAMSAFALLMTSCDPSTDDISSGFNYNVTAETVIAKATPVVVNASGRLPSYLAILLLLRSHMILYMCQRQVLTWFR